MRTERGAALYSKAPTFKRVIGYWVVMAMVVVAIIAVLLVIRDE